MKTIIVGSNVLPRRVRLSHNEIGFAAFSKILGYRLDYVCQQCGSTALPAYASAVISAPCRGFFSGTLNPGQVPVHRHVARDDRDFLQVHVGDFHFLIAVRDLSSCYGVG
jgi:hypothetical protein